jgi:hypothetical protein
VFTDTGWKFYTSEEAVSNKPTAQRQWSRTIGKPHTCRQEQSRRRAQDRAKPEWQKLGDAVLKLNKSEIDRLMKYIGRA